LQAAIVQNMIDHLKGERIMWAIVQSASGVELGVFAGDTEDQALDAMARDAGYRDFDAMLDVAGSTRDNHTLHIIPNTFFLASLRFTE
jgi:hypothetical protein